MFSQNHPQGHSSRLNGGLGGQRVQMPYNYQQGQHGQHAHVHQHQSVQQDHTGHNGNLGHHSSFSGGVMSTASPFTTAMQNGHASTTRGGQAQPISEHWADQLRLYREAERANNAMTEQAQPHYYARLKAAENKGIGYPSPMGGKTSSNDNDADDRRRPYDVEKARGEQAWHNLDMSGQGLRNLTPALFAYTFLNELYIASNKISYIPTCVGQLRQLRHLDASFNQITELPAELGMCTYLKQLLLFGNRIRNLPNELGSLHLLEVLGVEDNPLNPDFKQEIMEKGTKSLITMLKESAPIPPPPAPRKFITVQEDVSPSLERIKVFSWNILCDKYATAQTYGYTPTQALNWEYRKDCLLNELRDKDADFLCLQELSTEAKEELSPALAKMRYRGVQWPKTRAKTMNEKDAMAVDGCATFYKYDKYILLDKQVIEFAAIAINRPDMKNQHDVFNRVMPKDNIAVVCFLESRLTGARFILVNGHLAWETTLSDVKLIQTGILMEQIAKLSERYVRMPALKDKKPFTFSGSTEVEGEDGSPEAAQEPAPSQEYRNKTEIPLLVCGDFNSTVDSPVYELLSMGRIPPDHPELENFHYGSFTRDGIEHPFSLRDAYAQTLGTPDALPFTNYTPGFTDVIDYLWYSTNTLEVVDLLGAPDVEQLKRVPAFPNYHFPSDHIQIMAEFVVKARKDKKAITEPDFGSGSGSGR